jgi:uncharacterized ferritin-like protein (DUF455 family)
MSPSESAMGSTDASSVEQWAERYVSSTSLAFKCAPPPPPPTFDASSVEGVPNTPGRPGELGLSFARPKSQTRQGMLIPEQRARLLHKFWHHELQAAELMCWALVRYRDAELEFRKGLLGICRDEVRHMRLYQEHIEHLGFHLGDFAVRDWFWDRVPTCETKVAFVALLGMGLEAANLEHTERFARWFDHAGDTRGAELQRQVGREEVAHVRFAVRWFKRWTGNDDFTAWCEALPKPLTPLLMRGKTLNRPAREKAEMSAGFIDALSRWRPEPQGR